MAHSCKFKLPGWEHFDFLVPILLLLLFYVSLKKIHNYIMSACFGYEIQTVYTVYINSNIWHFVL